MRYATNNLLMVALLAILNLFSSCEKSSIHPLKPSEFNKELREQLGDVTRVAIVNDATNFNILPNIPPYDTSVYWYVQNLYNQVINPLRIDNQSRETDRWNTNRLWRVTILDDEKINAFVIPGGHFYITTGFLKAMETEHELFYVLAFEASLMNEKILLNRLISEYNTTILEDVSKQVPSEDGTDAQAVALSLKDLDINEEDVIEVDFFAADLICGTSVFDRKGIISIIDRLGNNPDFVWLQNRFYDNPSRKDLIENIIDADNCGSLKSNGGYQRYVLDILQ